MKGTLITDWQSAIDTALYVGVYLIVLGLLAFALVTLCYWIERKR